MVCIGGTEATAAPTVWCKHVDLASVWCAIRAISDGSAATYCGGRWAIYDAFQFAIHDQPPTVDRCAACVRVIDAERVQRGLTELANAQVVQCRVYPTACIRPAFCDARDACCAGDPLADFVMPDDEGGES